MPASVAQSDACLGKVIWKSQVGSLLVPALSFMEIYHEIFSIVSLPLPLIQEEQLSVSGERMCTSTGWGKTVHKYWLST